LKSRSSSSGIRARGEKETLASLYNLVKAAKELREEYK
jgi:methionine synthase II (cobalamin-independent)